MKLRDIMGTDTEVFNKGNGTARILMAVLAMTVALMPGAIAYHRIGQAEQDIIKIENRQQEIRDLLLDVRADIKIIKSQVEGK